MITEDKKYYSDDQICDTIEQTTWSLQSTWGVSVELEVKDKMRSKCYCRIGDPCTLVFGLECLRYFMKHGDKYETRINRRYRGLKAVADTVAHEYAHAVVDSIGWHGRGDWHNSDWWSIYIQMLKELESRGEL